MVSAKDLRVEVRKRHKAANAKVSRLKQNKGVIISGTEFDIRVDLKQVDNMNARQLRQHLNKLNKFTSRKSAFSAGSEGTPLSAAKLARYKTAIDKMNELRAGGLADVADKTVPGTGMSVEERNVNMRTRLKRADNSASFNPFEKKEFRPEHIASDAALTKLVRSAEGKASRTSEARRIRESRKQAYTMLTTIGDPNLTKRIRGLTNKQFDLVWSFGGLAEHLSTDYEIERARRMGLKDDLLEVAQGNQLENRADIERLIEWSKTEAPRARGSNKKGKK